jgi:hypothetical protein
MSENGKPKLKLCGRDGNAFSILGYALRAARDANWPLEKIDAFQKKATSGSYDFLIQTCMEYFDVE